MFSSFTHSRLPTDGAAADSAGGPAAADSAAAAPDGAALAALHADARHWSDTRICGRDEGFYFSKADPRVCVRKRNRIVSYTINFGHPSAVFVVVGFITLISLAPAVVNVLVVASAAQKRC